MLVVLGGSQPVRFRLARVPWNTTMASCQYLHSERKLLKCFAPLLLLAPCFSVQVPLLLSRAHNKQHKILRFECDRNQETSRPTRPCLQKIWLQRLRFLSHRLAQGFRRPLPQATLQRLSFVACEHLPGSFRSLPHRDS